MTGKITMVFGDQVVIRGDKDAKRFYARSADFLDGPDVLRRLRPHDSVMFEQAGRRSAEKVRLLRPVASSEQAS